MMSVWCQSVETCALSPKSAWRSGCFGFLLHPYNMLKMGPIKFTWSHLKHTTEFPLPREIQHCFAALKHLLSASPAVFDVLKWAARPKSKEEMGIALATEEINHCIPNLAPHHLLVELPMGAHRCADACLMGLQICHWLSDCRSNNSPKHYGGIKESSLQIISFLLKQANISWFSNCPIHSSFSHPTGYLRMSLLHWKKIRASSWFPDPKVEDAQ